jgi:signal peptide peptidase SppA
MQLAWLQDLLRLESAPPTVAVLRLSGVIGRMGALRSGLNIAGLAPLIERAFSLRQLKAVALLVNSPGGSAVQSAAIAGRIRALAGEKKVPVLAFLEDVAASGGYWLAAAADEIIAHPASIVGSIGVISSSFGFTELIAKLGIERRVHTAGALKSMLDPFRPEDPDHVARLVRLQEELHREFKDAVRASRGGRLKGQEAELFSGEFWSGRRALELGLVDGLGDLRSTLRQRYGEKVRIRLIDERKRWRLPFPPGLTEAGRAGDWSESLLAAIEDRAAWARFGL